MTSLERRRKILFSPPVLVITSILIFGVTPEALSKGSFSWIDVVVFGLPLGLFNMWLIKRQMQRAGKIAGVSNTDQQWTLNDSISTGKLPIDPKLVKACRLFWRSAQKSLESHESRLHHFC